MIDSLKRELKAQTTDKGKAPIMASLAFEYLCIGDSANTVSYAEGAYALYEKFRNTFGMANTARMIGETYLENGQWDLSEIKMSEALALLKNDTSRRGQMLNAHVLSEYSRLNEKMGMEKKSLQVLFEAAFIYEKFHDYNALKVTYKNIGVHFEHSGDQGRTGNYYRKSLEAALQSKNDQMIFESYLLNAQFMLNIGDFIKMNLFLEEAAKDHALPAKNPSWGVYFYLNANYYIHKKEYAQALECLEKAEFLIDKENKIDVLNILLVRVDIYKGEGNYPKALENVEEAYKLASHDTVYVDISSRAAILMILVEMEEKNGNYAKAYSYLQEKLALDRRVNMQEMPLKLRELDVKYQTAKKDKDLLVLQNNNKQQEIRIQKNRILNVGLVSGICILVLITALLFILFYNRRKLTEKKEIIYEQQIEGLKKEQELINYAAILEGQEQERSRLARDLHDGLNGVLSGIVMQLSALSNSSDGKEEASHLKRIIGRMNEAVTEVRNIAHNLMPTHLAKLGLDNGLRDLCNTLRSEQTDVIYRSYDLSAAIPQRKQITIYRMIQELVMNAVKHAGAKTILVECLQDGETLNITVEDDGRGFDAELPEDRDGIGMENIKKRVGFLKGSINIRSLIGTGTTIHIQCLIHD